MPSDLDDLRRDALRVAAEQVDLAEQGDRTAIEWLARLASHELAELGYVDTPVAEWLHALLLRLSSPFDNKDALRVIAPTIHPGRIARTGKRDHALERVDQIRRQGDTVANAFRTVGTELGVKPATVRWWYYKRGG